VVAPYGRHGVAVIGPKGAELTYGFGSLCGFIDVAGAGKAVAHCSSGTDEWFASLELSSGAITRLDPYGGSRLTGNYALSITGIGAHWVEVPVAGNHYSVNKYWNPETGQVMEGPDALGCGVCQDLDVRRVDLDTSIGYALKRTATALRAAMEASLRPLGLSVPQYSCLEILNAMPGISNADLARGVFVSRQAMHQLLGALQEAELVSATGPVRVQRYSLTPKGEQAVAAASAAVAAVEEQMLSGLRGPERQRLLDDLERCTAALSED
jgi:DNA-binding MarR family transcriptional regulator